MHQEQRDRTTQLLKEKNIDRALFGNFFSAKWLTGVAPLVQTGPNFFLGGPHTVWYEDGHYTLFIPTVHAPDAVGLSDDDDIEVVAYESYTIQAPITSGHNMAQALRERIPSSGSSGAIGVESQDMTHLMMEVVREKFGADTNFTAIDTWLEPLRMFKTDEELVKLRANFDLTDYAHEVARSATAAGQREVDIWTAAHSAVEKRAGYRVPFGNDCVVGYREGNNIGGPPLDYEMRPGDSLTIDLSTVMYGYWSDSCATYYAGEPNDIQKKMHRTAAEALELGISMLKPGTVAKDIDAAIRKHITDAGYAEYPHHTGHAVGVCGHERPRIVPYSEETIEVGMVILLEPGIYLPGEYNVRLEDAMLIKADGVELLTHHDKSMP